MEEPETITVKAKWARPRFPQWGPGESWIICLIQRPYEMLENPHRTKYLLPDVYGPEFQEIVPEDIKGKFDVTCTWGKDCIRVKWENRSFAMRIYAALLGLGYGLYIQTRLAFNMGPETLPNDPATGKPVRELTSAMLEHAAVVEGKYFADRPGGLEKTVGMSTVFFQPSYVWLKESAWFTEEGKEFVRRLRECKSLMRRIRQNDKESSSEEEKIVITDIRDGDTYGKYHVPVVKVREGAVALKKAKISEGKPALPTVVEKSDGEDDSDDGLCVICLEKPASTIVFPCKHCVACASCSVLLRKTADKDTCVKCRNPIVHIDE